MSNILTTLKLTKNLRPISRLLSAKSLTQKAYLNALASTLDYGAILITGFVVTPLLVAGLGTAGYGIWRTLDNLTGYISAASGRSSQALKSTIANLQSSTDYELKRRTIASAILVWLAFFPLLATLGGVLVWFVPIWIKGVPLNLYGIVRLAAGLLVARMILNTLTYLPRSVLEGENLGYKRMGLSATLVFVGGGLTILALYLNTGLVGVAVASLTTVLLTGLLFLFVVHSYVPWFGLAKPSSQAVRKFLGLSGWFMIWRLVMQLMMASDLVILGIFASAELVTTYALTKYAPETMINFVAILVFGSMPGLGGIIGSGDFKKAAWVRGEIMLLTWLVTTIIGTTILLWNQTFMSLWVDAEYYGGSTPTLLILVMISQFVLIRNDANIIDLTLDLSQKVLLGLLSATLSVVTSIVLVSFFKTGITGLVLGLIAGRSILSLSYPLIIGRFLGTSLFFQLKAALRPALVTILLFLFASRLNNFFNNGTASAASSWIEFFFAVAVTLGVISLLSFFLGLTISQQKRIFQRVRMVIKTMST
jgi:O-antigen/teichoic acid export membrane protein